MRLRCRKVRQAKAKRNQPREFEHKMVMAWNYFQGAESDWRFWIGHKVDRKKAIQHIEIGKAEMITRRGEDGVIRQMGIRYTSPLQEEKPSPTCLTLATMRAVSGEYQGYEKPTRGEIEEMIRFLVWPLVSDSRNRATVGPRMTAEQRAAGECLLGVHGFEMQKAVERAVKMSGCAM